LPPPPPLLAPWPALFPGWSPVSMARRHPSCSGAS
jgi:hypothetical protein